MLAMARDKQALRHPASGLTEVIATKPEGYRRLSNAKAQRRKGFENTCWQSRDAPFGEHHLASLGVSLYQLCAFAPLR